MAKGWPHDRGKLRSKWPHDRGGRHAYGWPSGELQFAAQDLETRIRAKTSTLSSIIDQLSLFIDASSDPGPSESSAPAAGGGRRHPPSGGDSVHAFLLMPFDSDFDWLHRTIVQAGVDVGVRVIRADDIFAGGIIIDQVKQRIRGAGVAIAVCTGRNANVFYELGIAEEEHQPILVAEASADLPFDVAHFRTHFYGGGGPADSRDTLRDRIAMAIRETLAGRGPRDFVRPPAGLSARETERATEDLEARLGEIQRSENSAYESVDSDVTSRGVLNSGIRVHRYVEVAEEHDRLRREALQTWSRRLEDASVEPPSPPAASATFLSRFQAEGSTYDRGHWPDNFPVRCGHCGRLAYLVDGGSWWCPEHKSAAS